MPLDITESEATSDQSYDLHLLNSYQRLADLRQKLEAVYERIICEQKQFIDRHSEFDVLYQI